ncbi:MAG: hypothetical protein COW12_09070, partial [Candidatus Omnitrophica bacterium CG12_big_fil_rev_8_21_14_0_65_45_16]
AAGSSRDLLKISTKRFSADPKEEEAHVINFLNQSVEARLFYQDLRQAIMNRIKKDQSDQSSSLTG